MSTNKSLDNLSIEEKRKLLRELLIEFPEGVIDCPKCQSTNINKHGFYIDGGLRYICSDCNKSFKNKDIEYINLRKKEEYIFYKNAIQKWGNISSDARKFNTTRSTIISWRKRIHDHLT